jgi:hypothetical protein
LQKALVVIAVVLDFASSSSLRTLLRKPGERERERIGGDGDGDSDSDEDKWY